MVSSVTMALYLELNATVERCKWSRRIYIQAYGVLYPLQTSSTRPFATDMALVSLSNGPAFPAEIISQFILHLEDDRDLQASSEVGIDWVSGARRGFFGSVMKLPSLGRVRGLAELLSSPLCTLRIQHRPTSLIMSLPDDEEVYHRDTARMMDTLVFPFLRDFVRIRLGELGLSLISCSGIDVLRGHRYISDRHVAGHPIPISLPVGGIVQLGKPK